MGVRYVEQGLQWLAGKGFQQKIKRKKAAEHDFEKVTSYNPNENYKIGDIVDAPFWGKMEFTGSYKGWHQWKPFISLEIN